MIQKDVNGDKFSSSFLPVLHGFGTKKLGDGRDPKVPATVLPHNAFSISAQQYHSTEIAVVTDTSQSEYRCDGLITSKKDILLSVITADCVPILFADVENQIIGISHQGWKGTLQKLPELMIQNMKELGADHEKIRCIIGPSINDCCYELFGDRLTSFQEVFDSSVLRVQEDKYFLNLARANYLTLIENGISETNIDHHPFCTSCDNDQFWSYKRDKEIQGEMLSFIVQN